MIRVNVMYPRQDGGNFDYEYYLQTHMPLVQKRLGGAIRQLEVCKGLSGAAGAPVPYVTVASLWFDSVDEFETAFGPHAEEIMGDIPNFTNIEPVIQIEERLLPQ